MKTRTIFEQHQGRCIHYQRDPSAKRDACKKGVVYDDLTRVSELGHTGSALRLPCLRRYHDEANRKGQPLCECPHLQWPTEQESRDHEESIRKHMEIMDLALPLVGKIKKERNGTDWHGIEECPACKGKLHIRHHAYNGHCWVRCETENCIAWIE